MSSTIINSERDIRISKALSKLLRHSAQTEGLKIDSDGYVNLNDVLNHRFIKSNHATIEDIKRIVETNNKKRFNLKLINNQYYICALQGHTIDKIQSTELIELQNDDQWPQFIIHGTLRKTLPLISKSNGISRMKRNHIHFSYSIPPKFKKFITSNTPNILTNSNDNGNCEQNKDYDHNAVSGIRTQCEILIFYDVDKLKNSNLKFYKSANDVILSPGDSNGFISNDYITKIIDIEKGNISLDYYN